MAAVSSGPGAASRGVDYDAWGKALAVGVPDHLMLHLRTATPRRGLVAFEVLK